MKKNTQDALLIRALSSWLEAKSLSIERDRKVDQVTLVLANPDPKHIEQIKTILNRQQRPFEFRFVQGAPTFEVAKRTLRDQESRQMAFLKRKPNDDQFYSSRPSRYSKL